jgi:hypothetical protein
MARYYAGASELSGEAGDAAKADLAQGANFIPLAFFDKLLIRLAIDRPT